MKRSISFVISLAAFLSFGVAGSSADQITLRNGDVLNGKVLSMSTNTLVLQDDSLGNLTLPRANVSNIAFGTVPATATAGAISANPVSDGTPREGTQPTSTVQAIPNLASEANSVSDAAASGLAAAYSDQTSPQATSTSSSISDSGLAAMAREIQNHSNLVQEVTAQVLGSSASPAAVNKINELLDGLSSGQIDMNGLRSQAQSAVDQLQEYKKQMGSDAGEEVNAYLSILNGFLNETAPAGTNGAAP